MAQSFNSLAKHSDRSRWICIYPAYINSKKTRAEGRLVPKIRAVENPTHQEVSDVLIANGFNHGIENKLYSRETSKEMLHRGRIRVQLKNDDGTPYKQEYPTRDSVLLLLADMIPKLKSRQGKQSSGEQTQQPSTSGAKKGKGKGKR